MTERGSPFMTEAPHAHMSMGKTSAIHEQFIITSILTTHVELTSGSHTVGSPSIKGDKGVQVVFIAPCTHIPEMRLYAKFSDTSCVSSETLPDARLPDSRL